MKPITMTLPDLAVEGCVDGIEIVMLEEEVWSLGSEVPAGTGPGGAAPPT